MSDERTDEDEWREGQHLAYTSSGLQRALGILCPLCPACGGQAVEFMASVSWPGQAMCGDDACSVLVWVPTRTAQDNLDNGREVDVVKRDGGSR